MATPGEDVTLECEVDAHPTPVLSFSRDSAAIDKIISSSKYDVRILRENNASLLHISCATDPFSNEFFKINLLSRNLMPIT